MGSDLTEKQRAILDAIQDYWREFGVPPSLADLAAAIGISRATAHEHVLALKRKGFIDHIEGAGRTWRPLSGPDPSARRIPVVGRVAAGVPILAQENIEGWITVDDVRGNDVLFALRVQGDSMIEAGILDGDLVVVRQQETAENRDIVVALIDDQDATVKRFIRGKKVVWLEPANHALVPHDYAPERVRLQGKVVGVRRSVS